MCARRSTTAANRSSWSDGGSSRGVLHGFVAWRSVVPGAPTPASSTVLACSCNFSNTGGTDTLLLMRAVEGARDRRTPRSTAVVNAPRREDGPVFPAGRPTTSRRTWRCPAAGTGRILRQSTPATIDRTSGSDGASPVQPSTPPSARLPKYGI